MKTEVTADDLRILDELTIDGDRINAYLEAWFDVEARFELTRRDKTSCVNLYADYYPQDQSLDVYCIVRYEQVPLSDISGSERDVISGLMREAGLDECVDEMLHEARQREAREHNDRKGCDLMSTELIRQVAVLPEGVYLNSKSNNDDRPFETWKCDGLTEVYWREGQRGLDREMVKMLCEYARIDGHHPSMERYRPCIRPGITLCKRRFEAVQREYAKLAPEDAATIHDPEGQRTPAAQAYRQFQHDTQEALYGKLARLAARVTDQKTKTKTR